MSFLIGLMLRLALSSLQARISERMNKPSGGEIKHTWRVPINDK